MPGSAKSVFDVLRLLRAGGPADLTGKSLAPAMRTAIDEGFTARVAPHDRSIYVITAAGDDALDQLLRIEADEFAAAEAMARRPEGAV